MDKKTDKRKKSRFKSKKQEVKTSKTENKQENKVPFVAWFAASVRSGKVKFWQEREISVFFKEKGLSESEEIETYNKTFELY